MNQFQKTQGASIQNLEAIAEDQKLQLKVILAELESLNKKSKEIDARLNISPETKK